MSYEPEEARERELFGHFFFATAAQCREIGRRKDLIGCYREWSVVDYQVKCGRFNATDPAGKELCERLADLDLRVKNALRKIIDEVLAEAMT